MVSLASLRVTLTVPVVLATAVAFGACSSSGAAPDAGPVTPDDAATCQVYSPPASFDPTTPAVTFSGGVLPLFAASCAFASCHGSTTAPQGGLFLGGDPARVYANLVGVAATDYPGMERVKPGDPASSYLLHRLDGDACSLAGCTTLACYELMPQGNPTPLPEATRLMIRGWIAQGALSDLPDAGSSLDGAAGVDAASEAGPLDDAGDGGHAGDASDQ